jgi:hypothetical protein
VTAENLILATLVGVSLATALGTYLFFRRYRLHAGRSHRWWRLISGNLIVLLFLASLVVLSAECYFRFWYDQPDSFGLMKTSKRWFERHYQANAAGWRDNVDYVLEVPAGKRRVTFVGDSFTVGHGVRDVDDRFVNLIRKAHHDWDVHCVGLNGWDTGQELMTLAELVGITGQSFAPIQSQTDPSGRIVLAEDAQGALFLGRDERGRIVVREPPGPSGALGRIVYGDAPKNRLLNSYQFQTVVLVYNLNDVSDLMPERSRILRRIYEDSKPGWLGEHSYLANTLHYRLFARNDPDISTYYGFTRDAYLPNGEQWKQQTERLELLVRFVRTGGGRLLVVTFPFLDQLGDAYAYREAHTMLNALWRRLGVPHLDLLPLFADSDPRTVIVNRYDAHPNEHAHAMAATAIGRFIEENIEK